MLRFHKVSQRTVKPAKSIELLRIELDPATNQLRVQLAERPIKSAESIADPQLRAHVQALLQLLAPEKTETEAALEPAMHTAPQQTQPPVHVTTDVPMLDDDFNAPFLERLRESLTRQRSYAMIKTSKPLKPPQPVKSARTSDKNADIFAQIDAILQNKLRVLPNALQVEIRGDDGGSLIVVGDQTYTQIDAIPDEGLRAHIRSAIAEWEARQFKSMRTLAPA